MNNPFCGYGRVIQGSRLIGRSSELRSMAERLAGFTGSLSVVGEHRIGKTSLVKTAIASMSRASGSETVLSWITLSTVPDVWQFYVSLLEDIDVGMGVDQAGGVARVLQAEGMRASGSYHAFRLVRAQLKALAKRGVRTVCVIDEFDAVRNLDGASAFIQQLRELADFQDETGFLAVFVSRRSLFHLEKQLAGVSNLDGICEKMYLQPLACSMLNEMFVRCGDEWTPSAEERALLYSHTGGHPFLSEMILCHAWDRRSMREGVNCGLSDLYGHYARLAGLLDEDGVLGPLIQLTVGPRWSVPQENLERLVKYGIIRKREVGGSDCWVGWSEHFQAFLEKRAREVPLWQEWTLTESLLRDAVRDIYRGKYGDGWIEALSRSHQQAATVFKDCDERRKKETQLFGAASASCLLEYTYPMDLWMLMTREWSLFQPLLKKDKGYWQGRFDLLARVRAPLAHSRECYIPQSVVQTGLGFCREISELLGSVKTNAADVVVPSVSGGEGVGVRKAGNAVQSEYA